MTFLDMDRHIHSGTKPGSPTSTRAHLGWLEHVSLFYCAHGMWDLVSQPGTESCPVHLEGAVLTSGPLEKPQDVCVRRQAHLQGEFLTLPSHPLINCHTEIPSGVKAEHRVEAK